MNYSFHPLAKNELKKSVDYYNKCGGGVLPLIELEFSKVSLSSIIMVMSKVL
jgi:hypothetical protein